MTAPRLKDETEARALEANGHFILQVHARWDTRLGPLAVGVGHDWDHPSGRCYVYVLRGAEPQNSWEPLAGPFRTHRVATRWIDQLLGYPR